MNFDSFLNRLDEAIPVVVYNDDGTLHGEYDSAAAAGKELNVSSSMIGQVAKGKKPSVGGKYIIRFKSEFDSVPQEIQPLPKDNKRWKPILVYAVIDKNIEFIQEIKSAHHIGEIDSGLKPASVLNNALANDGRNNHLIAHKGFYIFTYKDNNVDVDKYEEATIANLNRVPIGAWDLDGNFIDSYESIRQAVRSWQLPESSIRWSVYQEGIVADTVFFRKLDDYKVGENIPSTTVEKWKNKSTSRGERLIKEILTKNEINFVPQKRFENMYDMIENGGVHARTGKRYDRERKVYHYFDFYLPYYNTIIEFHGRQHYESIAAWGGEKYLAWQQARDSKRRKLLRKEKIRLLEIPYTEINNMDEIILNFLNERNESTIVKMKNQLG